MFPSGRTMHGPSGDSESPEAGAGVTAWRGGLARVLARIGHRSSGTINTGISTKPERRERGHTPSSQACAPPKSHAGGTQGGGEERRVNKRRRVQREEGMKSMPGGKELECASPALAEDGHGSRLAGGLEEESWAS